jgi:hypothetical protein
LAFDIIVKMLWVSRLLIVVGALGLSAMIIEIRHGKLLLAVVERLNLRVLPMS